MQLIYVSSEEEQLKKFGELLKTYSKLAIEKANKFRIGLSGKTIVIFYINKPFE